MTKVKNFFKQLWKDESAQGATEYILLLVVVVGLAIVFKQKIKDLIGSKLEQLGGLVGGFSE